MKDCLICTATVQESMQPWCLCIKCFRPLNEHERVLYKTFVTAWGRTYVKDSNFLAKLAGQHMTIGMLQISAGAVFGRKFFATSREMNYKQWATFFLSLYGEDEVVFDWLITEMLNLRAKMPIQPQVARDLADRHFQLLMQRKFDELDSAVATIMRFGIQIPGDIAIDKANRDTYAEAVWKSDEDEIEKHLADIDYLLWVQSCTHLPTYSRIRDAFGQKVNELEVIATTILDSLGQTIPEHAITRKLELALDDLEVTWPHLVNRIRANGRYIYREDTSAPTAKSVLVRLLVAKEQSLAIQLILWPSAKLQSEILEWRERAKLDKEPITHFVNSDAPIDNSPRGYVARSWKNRWRKDY